MDPFTKCVDEPQSGYQKQPATPATLATPATVDKILDALRAELQPLVASGRPFQLEMHGGPDKHVRFVITSYVDVNPTEPAEPRVNVNQRRK